MRHGRGRGQTRQQFCQEKLELPGLCDAMRSVRQGDDPEAWRDMLVAVVVEDYATRRVMRVLV